VFRNASDERRSCFIVDRSRFSPSKKTWILRRSLFYGDPRFVEAPVLCRHLFYGGSSFVVAPVSWRYLFYGGPCFVEAPVLWWPLFCGGPCFVEAPILWRPLFCGGSCFVEAPVLWRPRGDHPVRPPLNLHIAMLTPLQAAVVGSIHDSDLNTAISRQPRDTNEILQILNSADGEVLFYAPYRHLTVTEQCTFLYNGYRARAWSIPLTSS
jgi:hypothetical protein